MCLYTHCNYLRASSGAGIVITHVCVCVSVCRLSARLTNAFMDVDQAW